MKYLVFTLFFAPLSFGQTLYKDTKCPRLEGTNTECFTLNSPNPPPTGISCPPSVKEITCWIPGIRETVITAVSATFCKSWTCQVIPSPEGIPRKIAQCGASVPCCRETTVSCYPSPTPVKGEREVKSDCSAEVRCPSGASPAKPPGCPKPSQCPQGSAACEAGAPFPSQCR